MENSQENIPASISSDEIDVLELIKDVWQKKWDVIKVVVVFIALGFVIAFSTVFLLFLQTVFVYLPNEN